MLLETITVADICHMIGAHVLRMQQASVFWIESFGLPST